MIYRINEIFNSLQGEGYNQGRQVTFIRLSGCNLKCSWCDTDHTDNTPMSVKEILDKIDKHNCRSVIITGGEPTTYNLTPLLTALNENNYWIGIESNGTNPFSNYYHQLDYIAVSPKGAFLSQKVDEVRVVNDNCTAEQLQQIEHKITATNYYISPKEENNNFNILNTMQLIGKINTLSANHWSISLQLHKFADIR
ncbi:MAG: 7-carboxy-7-deazaguanine synthase QueE [Bacteroidales bacterium]|jgi:organic radical activating enzyme|nr:7-carboxy-7-deazaguanine synthase QueE [Bacteroidales bacterium]